MDTVKPGGRDWTICEQIIEDAGTGLTLQFEVADDGIRVLRMVGDSLPFGNIEIAFDESGTRQWTRVGVRDVPRVTWLRRVSP